MGPRTQDAWHREIDRLLAEVPEVLSDCQVQEAARAEALLGIRKAVAVRWKHIVDMREKVPESHYTVLVNRMQESLGVLLEVHGPHMAFPPNPPSSLLEPEKQEEGESPVDGPRARSSISSMSSTTASSGSGKNLQVLPHEFKFLTAAGSSRTDVWTCLQAWLGGRKA